MKKSIRKSAGILLILLLFIPSSCKKYEDGPWFSLHTKKERVTGNWRFEYAKEDGIDVTERYVDQRVNMAKNGDIYWVQGFDPSTYQTYGPRGTWRFLNDKMQVEMHFDLWVTEEFTIVWDIKRLAHSELKLERYEEGKKIEWKLWKPY